MNTTMPTIGVISGGNDISSAELFTVTIAAGGTISIPTTKKAKGVSMAFYWSDGNGVRTLFALDGLNNNKPYFSTSYFDDATVTYNNNSIVISKTTASSTTWKGFILY